MHAPTDQQPLTLSPPVVWRAQASEPITWERVRARLVADLMIDEEWMVDDDSGLTWWPHFLSQRIEASVVQRPDEPEPRLRVTATTDILRTHDADLALFVVTSANQDFPLGTFTWRADGTISATSSLLLHESNWSMVTLLREACLAQATIAHATALAHEDDDRAVLLLSQHPSSGPRLEPDEMLSIYAGPTMLVPVAPGYVDALEAARAHYVDRLLRCGFTRGWSNDEVDYFNYQSVLDIAVGRIDDEPNAQRYGPGLVVLVRWASPGVSSARGVPNLLNLEAAAQEQWTTLGHVPHHARLEGYGPHLRSYLGHGYLAAHTSSPEDMGYAVINAVLHLFDAALHLASRFGIDGTPWLDDPPGSGARSVLPREQQIGASPGPASAQTEMVRAYVGQLLEQDAGHRFVPDEDGDFVVQCHSMVVVIRVVDGDDPYVWIFTTAVRGVPASARLFEHLNALNGDLLSTRALWAGGDVTFEMTLHRDDVDATALRHACTQVAGAGHCHGLELEDGFGGTSLGAPEEESSSDELTSTGSGCYL